MKSCDVPTVLYASVIHVHALAMHAYEPNHSIFVTISTSLTVNVMNILCMGDLFEKKTTIWHKIAFRAKKI